MSSRKRQSRSRGASATPTPTASAGVAASVSADVAPGAATAPASDAGLGARVRRRVVTWLGGLLSVAGLGLAFNVYKDWRDRSDRAATHREERAARESTERAAREREFVALVTALGRVSSDSALARIERLETFERDDALRPRLATALASFIRDRRPLARGAAFDCAASGASVPEEVQRALTSLGRIGRHADAAPVALGHTDLRGASFAGAQLRRADLSYACLRGGTLDLAVLDSASLRAAKLDGASLVSASLRHAILDSVHADRTTLFSKAKLEGASFVKADLRGASLRAARLACATLVDAQLDSVEFSHARVRWADFRRADLRWVRHWTEVDSLVLDSALLYDVRNLDGRLREWSRAHGAIMGAVDAITWERARKAQWDKDSLCWRSVRER